MGVLKNIYLHCSASAWGDVLTFDRWHRHRRGWRCVGYHFVILNGRPSPSVEYWEFLDGVVQPGRSLDDDPVFENYERGAHVAGRNHDSIGICLVGKLTFTHKQLDQSKVLVRELLRKFDLETKDLLGHYEDEYTYKTCPNIPCDVYREYLDDKVTLAELQESISHHNKGAWVNK